MAVAQLSLTRRALLAGACAAPLAGSHPELVSGSSSPPAVTHQDWTLKQVQGDGKSERQWASALDRFREADARLASRIARTKACTTGSARDTMRR